MHLLIHFPRIDWRQIVHLPRSQAAYTRAVMAELQDMLPDEGPRTIRLQPDGSVIARWTRTNSGIRRQLRETFVDMDTQEIIDILTKATGRYWLREQSGQLVQVRFESGW